MTHVIIGFEMTAEMIGEDDLLTDDRWFIFGSETFLDHQPLLLPMIELITAAGDNHASHDPLSTEVDLRMTTVTISTATLRRGAGRIIEGMPRCVE
jgi:hypothetical protein